MIRHVFPFALIIGLFAGRLCGQTITWNCDPNSVNQMSDTSLMGADFTFELGVFVTPFAPTWENRAEWAQNWRPIQRRSYNATTKLFSGNVTLLNNDSPYIIGKAAYVWGFNGDARAGEWILFRATAWSLPDAHPLVPSPNQNQWYAKNATTVIGDIKLSGSPYLMKSVAVSDAAPPTTTWEQWQAAQLASEPLNAPNDDPDQDGVPNLLEFVFGTPPKSASSSAMTPVSLVELSGQKYLQLTIPRRIDRKATLVVEVSDDLETWYSGAAHTEVISDNTTALIVRDKTALSGNTGKRFMRLRATLP